MRFLDRAGALCPESMNSAVDKLRSQIQEHQRADAELAKLRPIDPLSMLPLEVFGRIIEIGVESGDPDFALRPSWVSRRWREAVIGTPSAWKSFRCKLKDYTSADPVVRKMNVWDDRSKGHMVQIRITINRIMGPYENVEATALLHCFRRHLDKWLAHCRILSLEATDLDIMRGGLPLRDYHGALVNLEEIYANEMVARQLAPPNLRVLDMTTVEREAEKPGHLPSANRFRHLRSLTVDVKQLQAYHRTGGLTGTGCLEELRVLHNEWGDFKCGTPNCPRSHEHSRPQVLSDEVIVLPSLKVLECPIAWLRTFELSALTALNLGEGCGCSGERTTTTAALLQQGRHAGGLVSSSIEMLNIAGDAVADMSSILPRLPSLRRLNIKKKVQNDSIEAIVNGTSHACLEEVVIADASELTGTPLMRMVSNRISARKDPPEDGQVPPQKRQPKLIRRLHLSRCDLLEKEAEDWLKRNVSDCEINRRRPAPLASYREKKSLE